MSAHVIEERHGSPGARRAREGVGSHVEAPQPDGSQSSGPASLGRCEHLGGVGGHVGVPLGGITAAAGDGADAAMDDRHFTVRQAA
jgi:hypothetical protein